MARLIVFNKPYGVLSQFTAEGRWRSLAEFIPLPGVYAAGRLDADSEGVLLLTDDGALQRRIADPRFKLPKTYWIQVEGVPTDAALAQLAAGVELKDFRTAPCRVTRIEAPATLWPRDPPIRQRAAIPTAWLEIVLREGKNRQVRRMAAAVGFPVLRLVRRAVGAMTYEGLAPGAWREQPGGYAALLGDVTDPMGATPAQRRESNAATRTEQKPGAATPERPRRTPAGAGAMAGQRQRAGADAAAGTERRHIPDRRRGRSDQR